jgi:hypothetical protein
MLVHFLPEIKQFLVSGMENLLRRRIVVARRLRPGDDDGRGTCHGGSTLRLDPRCTNRNLAARRRPWNDRTGVTAGI